MEPDRWRERRNTKLGEKDKMQNMAFKNFNSETKDKHK